MQDGHRNARFNCLKDCLIRLIILIADDVSGDSDAFAVYVR